MNTQDEADADGRIFGSLEDVARQAEPLGFHRAVRIFKTDPRAPTPVFGGGRAGAKEIYALAATRAFWLMLATGNTPSESDVV